MSSQLLYNNDDLEDVINVLSFINDLTESMGIKDVVLDVNTVSRVVVSCKHDFPHTGGVATASAFKQVANFVCHFVAERPLQSKFPFQIIGNELAEIENHQNAQLRPRNALHAARETLAEPQYATKYHALSHFMLV